MSNYYGSYSQYLGAQRCCNLKTQGPPGPRGPTGPAAVGEIGYTGPTGPTGNAYWDPSGVTGIAYTNDVYIGGELYVSSITASYNNQYAIQNVQMLNADSTLVVGQDINQRQVLVNMNSLTAITIDISGSTIIYNGNTYTVNIQLPNLGSTCELMYNASTRIWFVISTIGNVVFS